MNIAVLDAGTLGNDLDLSPLSQFGMVTTYETTPLDQVGERLRGVQVAIVNKLKMNEQTLSTATDLKLIAVAATGYDNIDLAYCEGRGIAVCNVPGYSSDSVAQLTLTMALSLATRLTEYRDFVHSGAYSAGNIANRLEPVYHDVAAMTWAVVGGGGIGQKVAQVAKAMGCRVLMCRRQPDERYETVDIDTACKQADILSLHVPLTDETRGMINRERIASMKDGAIVINVARGAVTDEAALAQAVTSGKLGGLGVDVYTTEPFKEGHPFCNLLDNPRVCFTPHMAWGSYESRNRCLAVICDNITAFTKGDRLNRVV